MTPQDLVFTPQGVRFRGRRFPCTIGKGGRTTDKCEGDGATPVGIWHIESVLYRPDRIARPCDWAEPILPGDLWSDAPDDDAYNTQVRAPYTPSHEQLRRADPLYDLVLISDWNWPVAEPGRGSAIFLHQWRRPGYGTEGCIAFRRDHLRWITRHLVPGNRVIVRA